MGDIRERIRELAVRAGLAGVPEPVLLAALAVALCLCALAGYRAMSAAATGPGGPAGASVAVSHGDPSPPTTKAADAPAGDGELLVVDVAGRVRRPGLFRLRAGSRVADAIAAAGGAGPGAVLDGVNLARKCADGEQILVPGPGSTPPPGASAGTAASGAGQATAGAKVDLNTADAAALDALPGVGPSTAKRIVDDRSAHGPFSKVDDLMRVQGIGPKKFDALKDLVTVGP